MYTHIMMRINIYTVIKWSSGDPRETVHSAFNSHRCVCVCVCCVVYVCVCVTRGETVYRAFISYYIYIYIYI
jgi:hypothetical protein